MILDARFSIIRTRNCKEATGQAIMILLPVEPDHIFCNDSDDILTIVREVRGYD